ncbi:hypothetical protein [Actinoallomurus sp. CA-150999]|uniref:hypothetical protein n=1 Tax=Actinoallomurus sp. CA-150999 TaxID=3239887 RepID=UPI003D92BDA1
MPADLRKTGRFALLPGGARLIPGIRAGARPDRSCAPVGSAHRSMVSALANTLTITVPGTASLGSGLPGGTVSASMGTVTVSDARPGVAGWTATVTSTNLTTGGGTTAETITNGNIAYWSGPATASVGGGARTPGETTAAQRVPLSTTVTAFSASKSVGTSSTSWAPTLVVTIPASAVAGTYTATVSHSVA